MMRKNNALNTYYIVMSVYSLFQISVSGNYSLSRGLTWYCGSLNKYIRKSTADKSTRI